MESTEAKPPYLSIVIPAYNEGHHIEATLREITTYLDALGLNFEIIVVDDGSHDDTSRVVSSFQRTEPRIRLIAEDSNRGKGYAVRRGMLAASGSIAMFIDADLSIPITLVPEFLEAIETEGYDIAIASRWVEGFRWTSPPSLLRRVMGWGFRLLVKLVLDTGLQDTQCGSKAYRGTVAKALFHKQRIDSFTFDAEVLFLARKLGLRVKEIPFDLRPSSSSSVNPVIDPIRMLKDLIKVRISYWRGMYG